MAGGQYGGWWLGLIVGFAVVVVVVALVAVVLALASRIGDGARAAGEALDAASSRLGALAGLERTNGRLAGVLEETRAARSETPR